MPLNSRQQALETLAAAAGVLEHRAAELGQERIADTLRLARTQIEQAGRMERYRGLAGLSWPEPLKAAPVNHALPVDAANGICAGVQAPDCPASGEAAERWEASRLFHVAGELPWPSLVLRNRW